MIYVTGDIHGEISISRLNTKNFPEQKKMTKDDYVIIVGDFGLVWDGSKTDKYWLDWLEDKPFTTLFIDGNHENFDLLYQYPTEEWAGGKVHQLRPSVLHLKRGEIFVIDRVKFFTFGGALSTDKPYRTEGKSWWPQEIPTLDEMNHGLDNLALHQNKVDVVLTHNGPESIVRTFGFGVKADEKSLLAYLEDIKCTVDYQQWFFGHWHEDIEFHDNIQLIHKKIVPLSISGNLYT